MTAPGSAPAARSRWALFDVIATQRRFVYLAVVFLSAAGIWSALSLPSAIYPELEFPRIAVVAQGSSLGARQVVFAVTRPLEEAVSVVPGVTRVQSRSIRGATELSITFAEKTDMPYALQLVRTSVEQIQGELPDGLSIEVERMTPSLFPIITYNLEGGDPAALYDIARYQIRPVLSRIPGVGRVVVQGGDVREIEVVADPARLAAAGLTYDDLAAAIKQGISVDAVGRVAKDYRQYLVVSAQEAHSVADIERVVVKGELRVRDLATVIPGTEDHVRIMSGDGKPAALINVTRQINGNTVAVADTVARAVKALAATLPPGVRLTPVYDQAILVRDAVASVRDAMLIGALLAVTILLVFLRHARITAISAAAIPLTLALTVLVMRLLGQTFNLMTLGAMAIAIGLVIDDAVVITENIVRHLHLTGDRSLAVREALQELILPVTTSTLTTVVVFLPLGLLEGVVGQFFSALSITLTVSVLVSLVLALTVIPLLAEQFLTDEDAEQGDRRTRSGLLVRAGEAIDGLSERYERGLRSVLHHRAIAGLAALALVGAGLVAYHFVGTGFLPDMDEGAFVLDYWTPGGTALAETDRQLHVVESILASTPEVEGTSRRTGAEMGMFATEQNTGDIAVRLKPPSERDRDIFEVMDEVRGKVESALPTMRIELIQILSDVLDDLAGSANPLEIKLFGPDLAALQAYAEKIAPDVEKVDGLEDFFNGIAQPSAEMEMKIREADAARLGLSPQQVSGAVSGAMLGVNAGEVRSDDRSIAVRVRAPDSVRYSPAVLGTLPVFSAKTGHAAPLSALADFTPEDVLSEHLRENQQQMIALTAGVQGRSLSAVMADVKGILAAKPAPEGIRVELGGRYASQQKAFRALLLVLALAVVSVMAVMVIQFRSFVEPLVVLLAAPLSFVGAMALLIITGTPLNVSSFMGLILLVGLIVKNGIILLDFTRHRMQTGGVDLETGICDAARVRLRPILMTTLCTLFGLLPLALGIGAGSELQKPLALAVLGGLSLSTPITLFAVPVLLVAIRGRQYRLPASA
ncbi:MAG TPA: efflux RND transporter permease subunit [Gemmatimonadaceae bacterium]|nr:efflux RND transporter permease subunit [Gemmatimonadaceae bacterium]